MSSLATASTALVNLAKCAHDPLTHKAGDPTAMLHFFLVLRPMIARLYHAH